MCGIAAIVTRNSSPDMANDIHGMTSILRHRGPDDEGYLLGDVKTARFEIGTGRDSIDLARKQGEDIHSFFGKPFNIGFGHRRLSIIDPSPSGHQPMTSQYGPNWIIFNGEIYTYQELRKDLEKYGYQFVSKSDTEVLLNCYHKYGTEVVRYLNGIFAFVIWDVKKRKLFIARDHFGVKPLYYYLEADRLVVASEIKAILQLKGISSRLDSQSLDDYLTFRYTPSPHTLIMGVKKLPPGHCLTFDLFRWEMETTRYHDEIPRIIEGRSQEEWTHLYSEAFTRAVRRQMVSDVPIGALLSGGVDSSFVTAVASSLTSKPFKTFTVGFEENNFDNEFEEAKEIAACFHTDHNEVVVRSKDYMGFLSDAAWYMDEPIGSSSSIAMYYLCRRVAEDVKVVLTGQGADEPLAGYARYKAEKYSKILGFALNNPISRLLISHIPRKEQWKRAVWALRERDWKARFVRMYSLFNDFQKDKLLKPDMKTAPGRALTYLEYWGNGLDELGTLNKMLYIDTRMWLADDLLNYGDKMSMAASVEARVPILDIDLIELIESMPAKLKLKGWKHGKYVHKLVAEQWLSAKTLNRPKKGFPTPVDEWFQRELSGEISDILFSPKSYCHQFFLNDYIRYMVNCHMARKEDFHRQLFALIFFEFWAKRFLG